mgnify:FL=1
MKAWFAKIREKLTGEKRKKYLLAGTAALLVIICAVTGTVAVSNSRKEPAQTQTGSEVRKSSDGEKTTYTTSGSVDVGTKTMSLSLDISEFAASEGFSMDSFTGGMAMPGMNVQSDESSSGTRTLKVEEVYVESGEEIQAGDPVLKLTQESVDSLRTLLTEDVSSAKTAYEEAVTAARQAEQQAQADYEMNLLYADYADSTYEEALSELKENVESKQEALTEAQENHDEAVQELEEKEALLTEEKQVLENASFTQEGTDKEENLYWWIVAYETEREAKELVTSLTEEIEELKDTITEYEEAVAEAERNLALANRDLQEGEIEAEAEKEKQIYQAENAQEIYEVTTGQGSFNEQQAKADYEEAQAKLEEFDQMIVDQVICAENDGVITAVYVEAGDTLTQDTELISVNDREEVTITLSVEEDDMDFTALGSQAQIVAAALPDQVFTGVVTEIGDAEIDSNTNKTTYSVVVTVQNSESLLYQDMTAEVTFSGKEQNS